VVLRTPWHGPIILSLSGSHGIDTGDLPALPLFALALAIGRVQAKDGSRGATWWAGRWPVPASAVVLGALLLLGGLAARSTSSSSESLLPAGGGTFDGSTVHTDARRAVPVNHWSHLALTYDGATLRLYVNGIEVSSRMTTGIIKTTTDPLWIGGDQPYGEYFQGLIDQVRVYDRVLSRPEVRAEMSTPIGSARTPRVAGLVGAYAFDRGSGTVAADASGNGNAGAIVGATWATGGRFGGALRFHGTGEVVRVPAAASLTLRGAMTLSAWIRPSEPQSGWRTILSRQTDAYFLTAGGGSYGRLGAIDNVLAALVVGATLWFCLPRAWGTARVGGGRRPPWWPPVALFLAGSLVDAALAPSGTLVGPILVAAWYAVTASHRVVAASMYFLTALFTGVTVVSIVGQGGSELARDDGSVARSVALGLLFVAAGLLAGRFGSSARDPAST
jgi:hypothetical protein